MTAHRALSNHDLKEDIREYWSLRSKTFDQAFGHHIPEGEEFAAWRQEILDHLGTRPRKILELACGTGEVSRLLLSLGHEVTGLDFSEAMLAVAKEKHKNNGNIRFIFADAENPMEPDDSYDAIVCRHLVWTLTNPQQAFNEWYRVLKADGQLLFFDGDWATPTWQGKWALKLIRLLDAMQGADPFYDGALSEQHADIMERLPFGSGLKAEMVIPMLENAGFKDIKISSHKPIAQAQRRQANLRNRLRTRVYSRFILSCRK